MNDITLREQSLLLLVERYRQWLRERENTTAK